MKSGNLNKTAKIKLAKTATQNKKFILLIQQFSETFTILFLINSGIICISNILSSSH